jgi:uncharacterized protein YggE
MNLANHGAAALGILIDESAILAVGITAFKRIAGVLQVLEQNGIRQNVTAHFESSKSEEIKEEVQKEAIEKAIRQAQIWARNAGVKPGAVADLTLTQTTPPPVEPRIQILGQIVEQWSADQNLINSNKEGELPQLKYSVTASVVLAIKPE